VVVLQNMIYGVILLAGLGWFSCTMYKRLRVLAAARSFDARGHEGERLIGELKHVFGQGRLVHGDPAAGLMHAFIFWGFVILLLNTLATLIGGPGGHFAFPLLGRAQVLGQLYYTLRDVFEVLVLLAVLYATFRRVVLKPKRLTLSGEALVILGLIGYLMVSDWFIGGAAAAQGLLEGWLSPAERIIGAWFTAGPAAAGLYACAWWSHVIALLVFLNLLPLGKHFHVLTSVFKVYLRNVDQQGEPARIDFEDESVEEYGVSRLQQLTWSNWLDSYSCTECGRCDSFCPANQTGKELSPKHIIIHTRDQIYAHQSTLLKLVNAAGAALAAPLEGAPEFAGEVHKDNVLWACTTCGACDTHCPLFIEHAEPIIAMRRHLVMEEEGRFPQELVSTFNGLERQGNPWGIGAHERLNWADGLDLPRLSDKPDAEWVYFAGCFASFDERNKNTARCLVDLLGKAGVSFAVLDAETCCGEPARRAGHEYVASALIEMNAGQFKDGHVKKVLTACPHCFNTLKHEYAQFGVEFAQVRHHSELLTELVRAGRLDVPEAPARGAKVVYHDSCYLGRYNGLLDEPRLALELAGSPAGLEAQFNRDKGFCCGAGGGRMFMEETEGQRVNTWRYEQLAATGAEEIAVACPFCKVMLADAAAEADKALPVEDIAVYLHKRVFPDKGGKA
jgi:Fe-S oxidoreductase